MKLQGLKLIAIMKANKIVSKPKALLLLLRPFIPHSQNTLETSSKTLSTNVASHSKISTSYATHHSYSFDFFPSLFPELHLFQSLHTLSLSLSLCVTSRDFGHYLLASSLPHRFPTIGHFLQQPSGHYCAACTTVCITLPTSSLSPQGQGLTPMLLNTHPGGSHPMGMSRGWTFPLWATHLTSLAIRASKFPWIAKALRCWFL